MRWLHKSRACRIDVVGDVRQQRGRILPDFLAAIRSRNVSGSCQGSLLLTLTIVCSLGQIASTIYVPSIRAIASALDTSVSHVQLTFVAFWRPLPSVCWCSDHCLIDAGEDGR